MKHAAHVVVPWSGFVRRRSHAPGAASVRSNVALMLVADVKTTVPLMFDWPVFFRTAVVPATKPVPVMLVWVDPVLDPLLGVSVVAVGAPFTLKQLPHDDVPLSVFVTVTFRKPVAAAASTVNGTVRLVELDTVVAPALTPVPETDTVAPATKPEPVIVVVIAVAPCPRAAGLTDVILPERNEPDLDDLPAEVREQMHFHPVKSLDEVLALALEPTAVPMVA